MLLVASQQEFDYIPAEGGVPPGSGWWAEYLALILRL